MSLFAGSRKKRCNYRRVVHSISDSDNEEHQSNENSSKLIVTTVPPQHDRSPEVAVKVLIVYSLLHQKSTTVYLQQSYSGYGYC